MSNFYLAMAMLDSAKERVNIPTSVPLLPCLSKAFSPDITLCMGESTSVFIQRFVKLKCAYGDLRILTISRIKRIKIYFFVLISFRSLVRSIHPTTCRSTFSEANACARVAGSGENCWRDPCFIHLRSPEQFEKMPCLSGGNELSVAIDKNVKKQMELEVDSGGGRGRSPVSTLGSKV